MKTCFYLTARISSRKGTTLKVPARFFESLDDLKEALRESLNASLRKGSKTDQHYQDQAIADLSDRLLIPYLQTEFTEFLSDSDPYFYFRIL